MANSKIFAQITSFTGVDDKGNHACVTQIPFATVSDEGSDPITVLNGEPVVFANDEGTAAKVKTLRSLKGLTFFVNKLADRVDAGEDLPGADIAVSTDVAIKAKAIWFAARNPDVSDVVAELDKRKFLAYDNSDEFKAAYVALFDALRRNEMFKRVTFSQTRNIFNWFFNAVEKQKPVRAPKDGDKVNVVSGEIPNRNLKCYEYPAMTGEVVVHVKTVGEKTSVFTPRTCKIVKGGTEVTVTAEELNKLWAVQRVAVMNGQPVPEEAQFKPANGTATKLLIRLQLNAETICTLKRDDFTPEYKLLDVTKTTHVSVTF